jgi:glycosyltransferase involved in cell wall biosynthesis
MTHLGTRYLDFDRASDIEAASVGDGAKKLKICFIQEPLHAGVGRHTVDVARDLAARGHEIHIVYSPVRLEQRYLGELSQHSRIHCHAIKMQPGLCLGDLQAFWRVMRYVKKHGPFDIIHGESSKGGGFARLLKLFGAKHVLYSPHAFVTLSPTLSAAKRRVFETIEWALSHLSDAIVCTSQNEREHALSLGIGKEKLAIVVNGRAPVARKDRAALRAQLGLPDEKVVIGFVGRLEAQKAPQRLIDVCLKLMPKLPNLHLLVVGEGSQRAKLETLLHKAGLEDRATWMGEVDAVQYMPAMDILAMPSMYEGFAYVLIEALQAGLPLVATPVGGTVESIVPGKNGIIVPHHPSEPLTAALRQLAMDANLRDRMARAASERAGYFSVTRMVDNLESLYYRVCDTVAEPSAQPIARPANWLHFKARTGL